MISLNGEKLSFTFLHFFTWEDSFSKR